MSLLVMTAACASLGIGGIGDVVATVRGSIEVAGGAEGRIDPACHLELFKEGRAEVLRSNKIPTPQFVRNYGLAPGRYYFEITCEGQTTRFRSPSYHITDMRYLRTPIDLGLVAVR